jgi:hypothetical protein
MFNNILNTIINKEIRETFEAFTKSSFKFWFSLGWLKSIKKNFNVGINVIKRLEEELHQRTKFR